MAEYIVMPKLGFDMREGVLVSWLKQVGEQVQKGDVVAEIESDKATLELESQVSGTLLKTLAEAGDVVPIGGNLAIVGEQGEDVSAMADGSAAAAPPENESPPSAEAPVEKEATPAAEAPAEKEKPPAVEAPAKKVGPPAAEAPAEKEKPPAAAELAPAAEGEYPHGVKATPVARRLAADQQIDLRRVTGSGPGGRIRKSDVEGFAVQPPPAEAPRPAAARPEAAPIAAGPDVEEAATSRLRQAIGRRMVESKTTVPHFYVTSEIEMARLMALRKEVNALLPEEQKVTVNDMVVKAAALALRDFPNLNASFGGDKVILHRRIHIGSAVAIEGGLLTVVQKDTDVTPLARVATDNKALIGRVRAGKSRPEDFEGSTFTVSNLGAYDVDSFVAIINPPETAILAVGSAKQVPVVMDGALAIGWRMKATLSADHRVTDGAEAARFMQRFKEIMEEPLRLLL
jgi:pyruvate dehydrogenase E2 component (dihydrolipoamide acetyltransferase)